MFWQPPVDVPHAEVRVVVTQTTTVVSGSSSDSTQLLAREPVSGLIAATPSGAEQAVTGFLDFVEDVAASLPVDSVQEDIVEKHFAKVVGHKPSRPLTRRAE